MGEPLSTTQMDWADIYGPLFMNHLNPSATFLAHLPNTLTIDERGTLADKPSREEAVSAFLVILQRKQHEPGVYAEVLHALDKSDQWHIGECLESGQTASIKNAARNRCLIRIFSPELVKVTPNAEMLVLLPCLSAEETNTIQTCNANKGNAQAAMKLLSYLVLKGEEMYGQLINATAKAKYGELSKDLRSIQESELSEDLYEQSQPAEAGTIDIIPKEGDLQNNMDNTVSKIRLLPPTEPLNVSTAHGEEGNNAQESASTSANKHDKDDPPHPPQTKEKLVLREYQLELAEPALPGPKGGKNTIVVAPTGSGKTVVAVKIAQEFLNYKERVCGASNDVPLPRKVIFLVNQVALAEQQSKSFQNYLGSDSVMWISGETGSGSLMKSILHEKSVLVMTAQILVNALQDHQVELSDIGMLILDECHNCQKDTPYNKIMAGYRDLKLDGQKRIPQIVGMTASLDIAKAKSQYYAETKILQSCANLDAEVISTVYSKECLEELDRYRNIPTEGIVEVAGRENDRFAEESDDIMAKIESIIQDTSGWSLIMASNPKLKIPSSRGTQTYEQWIVQLQDAVAVTIQDKAVRRIIMACTDHLKAYNDSLYINRDIRTKDALFHLEKFMDDVNDKEEGFDDTDRNLVNLFRERQTELRSISTNPISHNPVLEMLGTVLKKAFTLTEEIQEKRGILFVKTRASTEAIIKWIQETDYLKFLNPGQLIGSGGSGGMTQYQQVDLLELFRAGDHKLIVATSVAQEGLDIAKCNVVVRYNHISSVVARVQARGRNRAKGGQFYLVVDEQLKLKNKDLMNRIREQMMLKATETIQKQLVGEETKADILEKITKLQKEDRSERNLKKGLEAEKVKKRISSRVKLTCRKCGELACHNDDIRSIQGAHHIVINDEFAERYETKDNAKYPLKVDDLEIQKTLLCAECKSEWGIQATYRGMTLPLLKIASFVVEYPNKKQQRTKKWKDVIFKVKPISDEDLQKVVNIDNDDSEEESE